MKKTNPLFLSPRELKEREEKKKALEKEISEKIKKKISGTHFKACPWCGIEPWIDVECYSDCSSYRTVLKTCDHLDYHMCVDDYKIHKIPKDPLIYPNPRRRVNVGWNGGIHPDGEAISDVPFDEFPLKWIETDKRTDKEKNLAKYGLYEGKSGKRYPNISDWARAVNGYFRYLSDEYPYQCSSCHKKWRGYESIGDEILVDGKSYCTACAGIWSDPTQRRPFPRGEIIIDAINLSSLYIQDNPPKYYTSLDACLRCKGISEDKIYSIYHPGDKHHGWNALTGGIAGAHWEIHEHKSDWDFVGFVYEPSEHDLAILKKIKE